MQERYAEALADFRAGNDVSGFPTARKSGGLFGALGAKSSSPSGFFGNDIVEEGAPLIPLPTDIDLNDPIASIAENLGMSSQQFTAALVSSASDAWLEDNGISKEVVPAFDQTVDEFLAAEDALDQLTADGLVGVNATGLTAADSGRVRLMICCLILTPAGRRAGIDRRASRGSTGIQGACRGCLGRGWRD